MNAGNPKLSTQPLPARREIPDPQVREAADQFESARELLSAQPPGSGVVYPLINTSAVAIELYLKCLSATRKYTPVRGGWSLVSSVPVRGHGLVALMDEVERNLQQELELRFVAEVAHFGNVSFRDALKRCEGAFQASRYPFEPNSGLSKCPLELLMACSKFLSRFVATLPTTITIQP
jgi:hypothetical protein